MVECGGLENRCAARHRGFKSYFLRQNYQARSLNGLFFVLCTAKPNWHTAHCANSPTRGALGNAGASPFHDAINYSAKKVSITKSTGISRPNQRRSAIAACCTKGPAPSTVLQPQERASFMSSVSRGCIPNRPISSGPQHIRSQKTTGIIGIPPQWSCSPPEPIRQATPLADPHRKEHKVKSRRENTHAIDRSTHTLFAGTIPAC